MTIVSEQPEVPLAGPVLYVHSPHFLLTEALKELLQRYEYDVSDTPAQADIAILDLCAVPYPYSDPVPGVPTLALVHDQDDDLVLLLRKGYRGYLRSVDLPDTLLRAIHMIHIGEVWAERKVLEAVLKRDEDTTLTPREKQVLRLLGEGLNNRDIGERLGVTVSTVKAHITSILDKRKVKSRLELLVRSQQDK